MDIKRKTLCLLSLILYLNAALADEKLLIERYESWQHPVVNVFKKHGISLYKVHYSQDSKYPTFYVNFKTAMSKETVCSSQFYKIGSELLKANSFFSYALIDRKNNLEILVQRSLKSKKTVITYVTESSYISYCEYEKQHSLAHSNFEKKFVLTPELEKRIFNSPYKTSISGQDGRIWNAFLFAEDEYLEPEENIFCNGVKKQIFSKTGTYYIYLYDGATGTFLPTRIPVFVGTKVRMNIEGAGFSTLHLHNEKNMVPDILLVSQSGCGGSYYEAYGFSEKGLTLQQYFFHTNKKQAQFFGTIDKTQKGDKLVVLGKYADKIQKLYLYPADISGELKLQPVLP